MNAFETIADGVHLVRVPMPGGGLPYSLAYLIEDGRGRLHVIDPGSPTDEAAAALRDAVDALGRAPRISPQIVLTHLHADHAGGAAALRASTGAPVLMHEARSCRGSRDRGGTSLTRSGGVGRAVRPSSPSSRAAVSVPGAPSLPAPDGLLSDGDLLDVPGRSIRVVWTPGHTPGHLCLHDEDAGPPLHRRPRAPDDQLRTRPRRPDRLQPDRRLPRRRSVASPRSAAGPSPGHEQPFTGLPERCAALAEHHLRRAREVAAHPGGTVWDVARTLTWTGGWDGLRGFTLLSALSQTALHRDFVARGGLDAT